MAKSTNSFNGCKRAFLIILLLIGASKPSCFGLCIERERRALLDIEKDIYDPGDWLSSWRKGGDCCSWQGVTCDNATGYVTELDLQYPHRYDLHDGSGTPPGASKLNPSLLDLKYLIYLDLSMNNFSGVPIPELIGSLTHLEYLDLSSAGFDGTIPHQLGNLSSLQALYINYGILPTSFNLRVSDLHWLSRLTSLYDLELSAVDLSKAVDWIHDISKLPNLSNLVLEYCGLSSICSSLPPGGNFTSLTTIDLFGNSFNSTIPSWLFNNISGLENLGLGNCGLYGELPLISGHLSNLKDLHLPRNRLSGEIHLEGFPLLKRLVLSYNVINASMPDILWWNLTHLRYIELDSNLITGSLPKSLGNHSQLEDLLLLSNRLTGEIPEEIGNLRKLTAISLYENQLSGPIPDTIGNLANLSFFVISKNLINGQIPSSLFNISLVQELSLDNNHISGYIPKTIQNLHNLEELHLSDNKLYGPMFFCNLSSLSVLDLSNNYLSGRLPRFQNKSSQLVILNLSNNNLSGRIPDSFGSDLPFLEVLQLGRNDLFGAIPLSMKQCRQLVVLDLIENKFSGSIPAWIGESLSSLAALNLRSNRFNGQIPVQLSYLSSLQILDLSQNHLTGVLSLHFENFSSMVTAHLAADEDFFFFNRSVLYNENLWLIIKGMAAHYTSVLSAVTTIDLSCNSLSGEIPEGLTQLIGLGFLNLSRNHFTGKIPQNIGAMTQLQSLDLSMNKLSGKIPPNMSALHFLSSLNLSHNNLSGKIPSGNQFSTFDPSIYRGNQGLCGWPLPQCQGTLPPRNYPKANDKEREEDEDKYEMIWIYASAILGFLISFWVLIGTLIIKQSIRHAYFRSVDKFYDWIYLKFALGSAGLNSDTRT